MIGWIVEILMAAAERMTDWFVARDAPNFDVVQMIVALLLLTLVIAILAFWPTRWVIALRRAQKSQ